MGSTVGTTTGLVVRTVEDTGSPIRALEPTHTARVTLSLAALAGRIRTGCVYEEQPDGTFGLLVTRHDPRRRWRSRAVPAPIGAHWAELAPSVALLTGRDAGCRARRCRGMGGHAGHLGVTSSVPEARPRLGWDSFAAAYRAELDAAPEWLRRGTVRRVLAWLQDHPTLTILSFEPGMPRGEALRAWEERGAFVPWAQRHVFRAWLLALPPVVVHRRVATRPVGMAERVGVGWAGTGVVVGGGGGRMGDA